ncbi:MAG TPA: BON domain-containing protein [Steroidobacteraceae bacterium]|nr:BON domain-containing protein [Steroidobacteraceae bacterium]
MKPILVACIWALAPATVHCAAAGQQVAVPAADSADAEMDARVARVRRALQDLPDGMASQVTVSNHADIVILAGKAAGAADIRRITAAAEKAAAGAPVSSGIEIDAARAEAAEQKAGQLLHAVEDALQHDAATADLRLLVTVDDQQQVLLFGPVPSREARAAAERVAARVPGVRRVENRLVVPE